MPSMDDDVAEELTRRNLGAVSIEVFNSYLPQISELYLPIEEAQNFDGNGRIAYFDIAKWAKDPDEDNIEKLMNVYQVLGAEECNIALIYHRTQKECIISIAVVNNGKESDENEVESYKKRLVGALRGNFPGAEIVTEKKAVQGYGINVPECLRTVNGEDNVSSVAIVSNLATEKSDKFALQTMEKVIDGIVPKSQKEEYTVVLLATPVREQMERKNRLYELYSALAPYSNWQTNYTYSEMLGQNSSATVNVNVGVGVGSQSGVSESRSNSTSITNSESTGTATTNQVGVHGEGQAKVKLGPVEGSAGGGANYSHSKTKSKAWGVAKTVAKVATEAVSSGSNFGINAGVGFARSSSVSATIGKNEGITQSFVNYGIKHMLDVLEMQVQRLEESSALGLWDFAAYVISGDSIIANNVAHTYLALTQGEESFLAESSVNLWRADLPENLDSRNEKGQAKMILKSLSRLQHPEFCLKQIGDKAIPDEFLMYPTSVTATTSLSGKELARALNFPSKSVTGLPIIETASFGRNVSSYNRISKDFALGRAYHMHTEETDNIVELSKNSFTSHVFVTGSTGAGKTNTVTGILKKLALCSNSNVTFMVIEPAKGEYKDVLGGYEGVTVYGTNSKLSPLLRINPFSFPENIMVSEHIDRLVEIFNVCWPMFAAMPAILKDAVISAYEDAGWDIESSICKYEESLYPSFVDITNHIKRIMNSSEYSSDTKGDYTGALLTRIKSLTNGINGQIFTVDALTDDQLFDNNVIVDISRVGSVETKSLIMGLLVLKLQEYRLAEKKPDGRGLEHITVLEEAHNLLRRTSMEQSSESSNLLGKSVEMLTNSIAELRAFGEGFIIADQAPGLLDMAVIRNTNTKIIHRLPDYSDRELVGKAIGLNDSQIIELAKLEMGVAAVYQNDWTEAVLCKVDEFLKGEKKSFEGKEERIYKPEKIARKELTDYIMTKELRGLGNRVDLERLAKIILKSQISVSVKGDLLDYVYRLGSNDIESLRKLLYDLLDAQSAICEADKEDSIERWTDKLIERVNPVIKNYSKEQVDIAVGILLYEQYMRDSSYRGKLEAYSEYIGKGVR